jgi:hypothetical protein
MPGNTRLYDESPGKEYTASCGSNYYWVSNTGAVIGNNTDTPPDYSTALTPWANGPPYHSPSQHAPTWLWSTSPHSACSSDPAENDTH